MLKIIAVLCSLTSPDKCKEVQVTNSDLQEGLTMTGCLMGAPQMAEWMKQHPAERLAGWRCQIGSKGRDA